MADPRNTVRFDEINPIRVTYKIDNSTITYDATKKGGSASAHAELTGGMLAVTLSADDTVALAADGEAVLGGLVSVESDNKCVIQTGGYTPFKGGTTATLTRGTKIVGALLVAAKGYVRSAASGTAAELLIARGCIINNGDTAKVMVDLG